MVYRGGSWINIRISYSLWGYLASVAGNTREGKGVKNTKFPLPLPPPCLLCKRNRLLGVIGIGSWFIVQTKISAFHSVPLSLEADWGFWLWRGWWGGWTVWGKKGVSFNPRNMWLSTVDLLSSNHPQGQNRLLNKGRPLKKGLCLQGPWFRTSGFVSGWGAFKADLPAQWARV